MLPTKEWAQNLGNPMAKKAFWLSRRTTTSYFYSLESWEFGTAKH